MGDGGWKKVEDQRWGLEVEFSHSDSFGGASFCVLFNLIIFPLLLQQVL